MRLGIISDIHGVDLALRAVLADGARVGVDRWWVLGDLVLFGPQPVAVVELLASLDDAVFVGGNTDRYVLTDDQPHPHATPEAASASVDLVRRYGLVAAGAGWTRGVLDEAGVLGFLDDLPARQERRLGDGTRLLGVHASPASDDGPGFDTASSDADLASLLDGADTDWIVGGHTHDPTDREVGAVRVLNCGSVGVPRTPGAASWLLVDDGDGPPSVAHRTVGFDPALVAADLHRRRHPNREFISSVLVRGTFAQD